MVTSINTSDDLPGTTKGGVGYAPQMQTPTTPNPGQAGDLAVLGLAPQGHLTVDGAFAVGDNSSAA